ncbi:hypothetical protein F5B21DRAFT_485820 [Xylaria acuta]|nr:hypothetical protein F5B21DRAFT_485820 [Xylaria acuta]
MSSAFAMNRLQGRYSEVQDQSLDAHEGRYEGEGFGYHSEYHYAASPRDFGHDHEKKTVLGSPERQYKPTALRWPFLSTLLLALLTTLAFLIYAIVSLPEIIFRDASEHVEARGLYQSFSLIHPVVLPIHTPTMEYKAQRAETAIRDGVSLTSSTPFYSAPTESRNVGARARAESVMFVSVLITIPDAGDLGTRNIRALDTSTTTQAEVSEGLSDSTRTSTFSHPYTTTSPTFAESKSASDFGRIGTKTVTEALPYTTTSLTATESTYFSKPESDFGRIGTRTVTEALPDTTTSPTFTESKPESDFGKIGTKTISNQPTRSIMQIETVTHVTLGVETITGTDGSPIAISTKTLSLISSLQTSTLTNSEGQVTATQVATVTVTPSVSVGTDSFGNPTATVVTYPTAPSVRTAVYVINGGHYFIGTFLPTLVASILAIAVQILDTNVKSFQPWHALTHERGALGRDSLCLETGGWRSLVMSLHSLAGGQAVVFLASLLSLSSAVLIPVSAGAIALDLRGDGCKVGGSSASNCAYVLSVSPMVAKAAVGILAVMSLATILLVVMVGRWRLGVYANPWSMCTLASLSANPDIRRLVLDAATGVGKLKCQDFKLDYYSSARGHMEYGIVAFDRFSSTELSSTYASENAPLTSRPENNEAPRRKHGPPFVMLGIVGRLCMLFILSGVLVLVLYYARTGGDTAFERFIDSDSFGVQFLFTSLGVIISLFWSSFYSAVAIMIPYQMLTERPQEASQSILLAPPTNPFSGLWHAARTHRLFLGVVSLASILSQFLSIFLSNVPFQITQTFLVYQLSIWTAVGIMSSMFLILLASFFVKWPDMPIGPGTIAGAMYYVCNTSAVDIFEGLSTLSKKERDRTVTDMALLYELGETMNPAGGSRIGLNILQTNPYPGWSYHN